MKRFYKETILFEGVHCESIVARIEEFSQKKHFNEFSPELILVAQLEYAKHPRENNKMSDRIRYIYDKCVSLSGLEYKEYDVFFEHEFDEDSWFIVHRSMYS